MNLHKNARTCPRSRALNAKRALEEGKPGHKPSIRYRILTLIETLSEYKR